MEYRQLGSTGVTISEIGFGCGNTAGLMIWGTRDEQVRVAERALEAGINYFDTASSYGEGKSEENLGQVLPQLSARPLIGTKVAFDDEDLADIPGAIRRSIERSLKRLGVDHVDVVHVHNRVCVERTSETRAAHGSMMSVEEMVGPGGVQETFEQLQKDGKLRFFGFCAFGGEVPAVDAVIDRGRFHSVLASYNMLNPSAGRPAPPNLREADYGDVITKASARGIGVVGLRVIAAGALSGAPVPHEMNKGGSAERRGYETDARRALALEEFRLSEDETLAQVAVRFGLSNSNISTVLVGVSEMSHVEEAVACSGRPAFSEGDLARLELLYATDFGLVAG